MDRDIEKLVKENNEILHKMHSSQVRGRIFKAIYWFIILLLAFSVFYFIQPYIEQAQEVYTDVKDTAEQVRSIEEDSGGISKLLDLF